jgi:hypothetical protein
MSFAFNAREWRIGIWTTRNSYHDEFIDFPPCTSRALSHFFHGPNHHSYDFGS